MTPLSKIALDYAGDAFPAEEPQATADRQHVNDSFYQDGERDRNEPMQTEYKFFLANGELDVSGLHSHDELRERNNVPSTHDGPMAVGNVTVEDGVAIWEVISNMSSGALSKLLRKYTQQAGWEWGGMTDRQGDPIGSDEKLAKVHIRDHDTGEVVRILVHAGRIARAQKITPGVLEYIEDFSLKLAEYPGGSNMTDDTMMKNPRPLGEDLELKNIYDPNQTIEPSKDRDRMPNGLFKCPECGRLYHRWNEYLLHRQDEEGEVGAEVEDGKFPEINDANYHEWDPGKPGIHTGGWHFSDAERHQHVLDQNRGQDLEGMPTNVKVPGIGALNFGSHREIQDIARTYNEKYGIDKEHPRDYVKVNPDTAKRIAEAFDAVQHNPNDPQVQAAYDALKRETMQQYQHITDHGYQFSFYPEGQDPYPNSPREAVLDLHHNKHMHVYPTEAGYGQEGQSTDHPLLERTGLEWDGKPVTYNDAFRAVHDFFGHAKEGIGFRHDGEDNAYRQHAAMYSDVAIPALAAETRGQNSWVNFGPHGESNQTAGQGDTVYAEQKAAMLPEWVHDPDLHKPRTAAKQPKDMFDKPVPFIYDIDEDAIFVGHPGSRHAEIQLPTKLTPGGIVEGEYHPGGKVIINSTSDTPYTVRHLVGLWYWQHPEFEVTSVELTLPDGNTRKIASQSVGAYVISQAAADPAVHEAWQALQKAGGKVYAVGGVVRDALMGKPAKDVDLMVTGLPHDAVHNALKGLPGRVDLTGKDFGVYRYNTEGYEVEVALPRVEKSTGERRVDFDVQVDHELPVEKDLERRDFTANAIAVDLKDGTLVDPFGGATDIHNGTLRTVHPDSFKEDPTRLVRGLVAHARHGLEPDDQTLAQMKQHATALSGESAERIQAELDKLMKTDNPAKAILLAHDTGLLRHILPEVDECFDFDQKNPHHNYDLGTHLLNVLRHTANQTTDPDVRLAALLHDIGKPRSQWINPETGIGHYYKNPETGEGDDHETVGAEMAANRMKALKYPNARINRVRHLVQHHMYPDFSSDRGARKFVHRVGDEHAEDLFVLREADRSGKGTDDYQALKTPVDKQRELVQQVRERQEPVGQSNLAVNGNDLIGLGIKPGPALGQILKTLTDVVIENPELNEKNTLLNYVRHELAPQ